MLNLDEAKTRSPRLLNPLTSGQPGRIPEIDTSKFFEPLPESELWAWECSS